MDKERYMFVTLAIKNHILNLPDQQLFTTRELLSYGRRSAVDKALFKMVRAGTIQRIARGVFAKQFADTSQITAEQVARIKAESFGKKFVIHCADAAHKLGLSSAKNSEFTFAVDGRSSSFKFRGRVVHLKGISARKMRLGDNQAGQLMRATWHMGYASLTNIRNWPMLVRREKQVLIRSANLIPAWLADRFKWYCRNKNCPTCDCAFNH